MRHAPERIWAAIDLIPKGPGETTGSWVDHGPGGHDETFYIRADIAQPQWQPIETAPMDGTDVLLWQEGWAISPVIVGRNISGGWLSDCFNIDDEDQRPTHWMPLPAPPETDERDGG